MSNAFCFSYDEEKLASCVEDSIANQLDNLNEAGGTDFSDIEELYDAYHQQTKTIEAQDLKIIQMEMKMGELEEEVSLINSEEMDNEEEIAQMNEKIKDLEKKNKELEELLENFRKNNLEPQEEEDADNL